MAQHGTAIPKSTRGEELVAAANIEIVYRPARGSHLTVKDAQVIGPVLRDLEARNEGFNPAMVVEAARPKGSPLNPYFEWDNRKAAESYRLDQARLLSRSVIIVEQERRPDGSTDERRVRAFFNVSIERRSTTPDANEDADDTPKPTSERRYVSLETIRVNDDFHEQVVARAQREALAWRNRWQQYRDLPRFKQRLGGIMSAIDDLGDDASDDELDEDAEDQAAD